MRRSKMAAFVLPATIKSLNRGEPVLRIHFPPNGTVVTLREDGVVSFWTPKLYLKSKKNVFVGCFYILTGFFLFICFACIEILHFFVILNPLFYVRKKISVSLCSLTDPSVENQNGQLILCQCQSITN